MQDPSNTLAHAARCIPTLVDQPCETRHKKGHTPYNTDCTKGSRTQFPPGLRGTGVAVGPRGCYQKRLSRSVLRTWLRERYERPCWPTTSAEDPLGVQERISTNAECNVITQSSVMERFRRSPHTRYLRAYRVTSKVFPHYDVPRIVSLSAPRSLFLTLWVWVSLPWVAPNFRLLDRSPHRCRQGGRLLGQSDVVSCSAVLKPWRRGDKDQRRVTLPRPDQAVPSWRLQDRDASVLELL